MRKNKVYYLFVSDCGLMELPIYLVSEDFDYLMKMVLEFGKGHYPKDEPEGEWVYRKKSHGVVQEKTTGDILGWIYEVNNKFKNR